MEDFYKRLIHLRTSNNMSQKELAQKLNIERSSLSSYETGRRSPDAKTLMAIADIFGVSVDYLLGRDRRRNHRY